MNPFEIDPETEEILAEIKTQTDRAVAIIAMAFIEDRLVTLLQTRLVLDSDLPSRLFSGHGPLGTLSAKIDMAQALRLIEKHHSKDLKVMKDIRNDFAHSRAPIDFNTQKIRDKVKNLTIVDRFRGLMDKMIKETGYAGKVPFIASTSREIYVWSAICFLSAFTLMTKNPHRFVYPKPPVF